MIGHLHLPRRPQSKFTMVGNVMRKGVGIAHVYWLPWLERHYYLDINLPPSAVGSENTQNDDFVPASPCLSRPV